MNTQTLMPIYVKFILFYRHTVQYVFDYRLRDLLFGNKAATCLTK